MSAGLVLFYIVGIAATFVTAVFVYFLAFRRVWMVPRWLLVSAIAVVPPLLFTQQAFKYASLHMYADVSYLLQFLLNIATTGAPVTLTHEFVIPGTLNFLSAHFAPLAYVIAIPFAFLPYPQTLLAFNVFVMCSAAIPLYKIAQHRTGDRRFALLTAALFLWYPTFQYTTLYEFDMLRLSVPVLFWMLYTWERQWIRWYHALVFLAVLVREEVGLTVAMFGAYLILFERRRWHGAATLLIGFGAFVVITQAIIPMLRSGGGGTDRRNLVRTVRLHAA
jgi:uncharacterized membrane protein